MANRASFSERDAWLFTPFGRDYALRLFGADVVDALPRYVRGKHKGELKGLLRWRKVDRGGWCGHGACDGDPIGYVETRVGKVIEAWIHAPAPWGSDAAFGVVLHHWQRTTP